MQKSDYHIVLQIRPRSLVTFHYRVETELIEDRRAFDIESFRLLRCKVLLFRTATILSSFRCCSCEMNTSAIVSSTTRSIVATLLLTFGLLVTHDSSLSLLRSLKLSA